MSPRWMQAPAWAWVQDNLQLPVALPESLEESEECTLSSKSYDIVHCVRLAQKLAQASAGIALLGPDGSLPSATFNRREMAAKSLGATLMSLHLLREEFKMNKLSSHSCRIMTPILVQLGIWINWKTWSSAESTFYMLEHTDSENCQYDDSRLPADFQIALPASPPSIFQFIEDCLLKTSDKPFTMMSHVADSFCEIQKSVPKVEPAFDQSITPRLSSLTQFFGAFAGLTAYEHVSYMLELGIDIDMIETLPLGVATPLRTSIESCRSCPPTSWGIKESDFVGRDDLSAILSKPTLSAIKETSQMIGSLPSVRDVHSICAQALVVEDGGPFDVSAEADRQAIMRLLFREDQRFAEAAKMLHPLNYPVVRCEPESQWTEQEYLEAQQDLSKVIALRTLSVSLGRGLLFYNARLPLLTEKFPIHGFTLSCTMRPSETTVTADRAEFSEEQVSWAFFHAGAEAGLSISQDALGIDTSWILYNKPRDLTNRHAGFLLALGLNGHLKTIAKWVAFRYLTPKHNMTSIGLLLGLSASRIGTMDVTITRLLSVHVTRMLPVGAAELNLAPHTQTCGLMGIGLLYCETQHRRMSEIMISEIENMDSEDLESGHGILRSEGYRLAAGFALGLINLGHGESLRGMHDMRLIERLLGSAVATKIVNTVHIADTASAGAIIAITLISLKTNNRPLARKIDVPDTTHQFEFVRPDLILLRTLAKHLIMWDEIRADHDWIFAQLPGEYQTRSVSHITTLSSEDLPFLNILAGTCLAVAFRHAGSGNEAARDVLCLYLDQLIRVCRIPAENYDAQLARIAARNCQDIVAIAAACVMAGRGDLIVMRRLRSLHGRSDPDTTYGSHLATHLAVGILFLGGGTHTLGTSNRAVAALLCAFYPLWPAEVLDNDCHLQAFRHFWVLAVEKRCLVVRDIDSHRPLALQVMLTNMSGAKTRYTAPCILPELTQIRSIETDDSDYWPITLSFETNVQHLAGFNKHQSIFVRRKQVFDVVQDSIFSATLHSIHDENRQGRRNPQSMDWVFSLPAFNHLSTAEKTLVLPSDPIPASSPYIWDMKSTSLDDKLLMENLNLDDGRSDTLWNVRLILTWAKSWKERPEKSCWIRKDDVDKLKARVALHMRKQIYDYEVRDMMGVRSEG